MVRAQLVSPSPWSSGVFYVVGLGVQPLAREDSGCCSCHSVLHEVRSSGGLSAYLSHAMSPQLEHILGPHFNVLSRDVTAVHPSRKHVLSIQHVPGTVLGSGVQLWRKHRGPARIALAG